jgi:hypothetical protein
MLTTIQVANIPTGATPTIVARTERLTRETMCLRSSDTVSGQRCACGCEVTSLVSAWTIVASQVFPESTIQNLAIASALAISGLAIVGVTAHELANEHALMHAHRDSGERESGLASAA